MNAPINFQTITGPNGLPAFVVLPIADFERIRPALEESQLLQNALPHAVVQAHVLDGVPLARAWRQYMGLTQFVVAERAGISQAALSQIESGQRKLQGKTLQKLADALGLTLEQLSC